jgi:O-antigen ligase
MEFDSVNFTLNKNKYEEVHYILLNSFLLLIIAQFDKNFIPSNYALLIIPLLILIIILKNYFIKSQFLFILLIFIGSHFSFLNDFGGTFSIAAISVIGFNFLRGYKLYEFVHNDKWLNVLIFILVFSSLSGWIFKSPLGIKNLGFSIVTFFSFILMFLVSSKIIWTLGRIRIFSLLISIIMIYAFVTAIVKILHIFPFPSALWGTIDLDYNPEGRIFYSILGRPTSAIGVMYFSFLFPYFLIGRRNIIYGNNKLIIGIGIICSTLVCLAAFTKSHSIILLVGFIIIPLLMMVNKLNPKTRIYNRYLQFGILAFCVFLVTQPFVRFETLIARFKAQPELVRQVLKNPILLKGTSREESFTLAMKSLKRENWIIGYGYANAGQNKVAWFGKDDLKLIKKDFHNTYYSLPQIFGWIGAVAYLSLFIVVIIRMRKIFVDRRVDIIYRIFAFSFFILFIIHLMTEYSITALSSPNYLMTLFILLGFSFSLFANYKCGMLFQHRDGETLSATKNV